LAPDRQFDLAVEHTTVAGIGCIQVPWVSLMLLSCAIALAGCHAPARTTPASPHRLVGVVRSARGAPVAGAVVIATDPITTNELAMTRTGPHGRFALEAAVPQVAITATTARESLFLPRVNVGGQDLALRLDASCTMLRGQIDIDGPSSAELDLIRIGRLGNAVGDTFGAPVDASQRFEACLVPSEYFVTLPPIPSDFRCIALALAISLVESRCPDEGRADGSPVFRASPWTRAALPTPRDPASIASDRLVAGVAFAVT
jgi:hypothetical protein